MKYWDNKNVQIVLFFVTRIVHAFITIPLTLALTLLCYGYIKSFTYTGVYSDKYHKNFMFPIWLILLIPILIFGFTTLIISLQKKISFFLKIDTKKLNSLAIVLTIISTILIYNMSIYNYLCIEVKSSIFIDPFVLWLCMFLYFILVLYLVLYKQVVISATTLFKTVIELNKNKTYNNVIVLSKFDFPIYVLGYFLFLFFFGIYIYITEFRVPFIINLIAFILLVIITVGLFVRIDNIDLIDIEIN